MSIRPRPTTDIPITIPLENAVRSPPLRLRRAATTVLPFEAVAIFMPI